MNYKLESGTFKYYNGRRTRIIYLANTLGGKHYKNVGKNSLRCKCRHTLKDTLEFRDEAIRAPELYECISRSMPICFYKSAQIPLRKVIEK
ncbi:MAG TPA: hypothetical protein DCW90_08740 [Lachnospiraceae bacterium]|nr:hypothetical protein [Lachnospiraceae bacterium]